MAVHELLLRGMIVGVIAGLVAFAFARFIGEPAVERAIAFESAQHAHAHNDHAHDGHAHEGHAHEGPDAEEADLFSRATQAGMGLLIGMGTYGIALGGLFGLLFAAAYGRLGRLGPRPCAALLALICFVAVFVVPFLKYPANPPAVGAASTIGVRTGLYFSMIAISIVASLTAFSLKRLAESRVGGWYAGLIGAAAFVVMVGGAGLIMPAIDEVPTDFPASVLWQFRLSALGAQAVLWSVMGLLFGALTARGRQS